MAAGSNTLTAFSAGLTGTDQALVTAVPNRQIAVVAVILSSSAGTTGFTFNSKGSGAGTAVMGTVSLAANGGLVLPHGQDWFRTNLGEALTATAVASTSVTVVYRLI